MQPVEQKKKTSPWLYVGIGCGVLLLLGIGGTVAAVMFGVSKIKEMKEDMANPITRTERVKKMLGAQALPDGYNAIMALSVPMVMDTAILSTRPFEAPAKHRKEKGDERIFMYFHLKASTMNDREQLTAFMEGRSDDPSVLARNNIHINTREIIGRGVLQLDGRRLLYLAQRGEVESQGTKPGAGLTAVVLFDCPDQTTLRTGMWMAPDPSPQAPIEQLDLKGTPGDPEAVKAFMAHFNPCQES
ncbi:MAG: hypothetical protein ACJ8AT_23840 [Hyalangium sp.]|uniref:hypothetical protein n=1 Tax=Hyalangium sp. TaxID=2028555 RepID=UPI003899E9CA